MSKGFVTAYAEEIGVWVTFQHVGHLRWREADLNDIGCATGQVHRPSDATDSMVVRGVAIPTVDAHWHRPPG